MSELKDAKRSPEGNKGRSKSSDLSQNLPNLVQSCKGIANTKGEQFEEDKGHEVPTCMPSKTQNEGKMYCITALEDSPKLRGSNRKRLASSAKVYGGGSSTQGLKDKSIAQINGMINSLRQANEILGKWELVNIFPINWIKDIPCIKDMKIMVDLHEFLLEKSSSFYPSHEHVLLTRRNFLGNLQNSPTEEMKSRDSKSNTSIETSHPGFHNQIPKSNAGDDGYYAVALEELSPDKSKCELLRKYALRQRVDSTQSRAKVSSILESCKIGLEAGSKLVQNYLNVMKLGDLK